MQHWKSRCDCLQQATKLFEEALDEGQITGQRNNSATRTSSHFISWQEVVLLHRNVLLLLQQSSS